ncbi:MAG TPA: phosphoribosylformylglycinamidine synthase subunit PurS [Balneolaceae bacterium]|nr:phosphoribosylformylglycinamidine synthase subunit PurS [Balneolaceae bacterium]
MYKATVNVTLRKSILDPQGKATHHALQNLGLDEIENVRIGKLITLDINADSPDEAQKIAEDACSQLLANEVMENFKVEIDEE